MSVKVAKSALVAVIVVVCIIIFFIISPFYTLKETEIAVITQFGKPRVSVNTAGLHWKVPFIDKINILPKMILEWNGEIKQFPTYDKRMILVDTTVRWKILDPKLFFESLSTISSATARLDDILDAASRQVVSQHTFESLVRDSNRIIELDKKTIQLLLQQGFTEEDLSNFPTITGGRSALAIEMKNAVANDLKDMGIDVVSFYIKQINYIDENLKSVFDSMVAERRKIAQTYRSEGENYREKKFGEIEKKTKEIMAEAQKTSKEIMGKADAKAAQIYNDAYNKNASTRDFYEFLKKMDAYKKIPKSASLLISTDSEFFDMFKSY
ncbi:MAG TPA: protease modulator HflC [Spirochaetota bacterium]|jgi:membrane protease subunit HflC|nr:MAG: Modulator of FtsH protease HflC [Spirochaetes bacterium ADurb.Bin133]HNZ25957.1 protease modulator HflC [Spirochaetota bacterium]HPY86518.1 protease modulator HflC [Spirochaetota bacterium]HQB60361.1 protease modulator HflC [Spirochaetota bacterium]